LLLLLLLLQKIPFTGGDSFLHFSIAWPHCSH
jgi:hypothetical protein